MKDDTEAQIVWRLSKAKKGRYVAASRKAGKTLVDWLEGIADAASQPIGNDHGTEQAGDVARQRTDLDQG
ncbi:MAG: hypothetical protein ABIT37_01705 [Luteolibacter sp.]